MAKKKPNAQDATLRNIRALKKRVTELERVTGLQQKQIETLRPKPPSARPTR